MKKLCALLLSLSLAVLVLSGCGSKGEKADGALLYDKGLEVISLMDEIVSNEKYLKSYTASEELFAILEKVGNTDHVSPNAVYCLGDFPKTLLYMALGGNTSGFSEELVELTEKKVVQAIPTQINARGGANTLAAASVATAGCTFDAAGLADKKPFLYLYVFDDVSCMVTFAPGEDDSVSASGCFILYDGFDASSKEKVEEFFGEFGAKLSVVK